MSNASKITERIDRDCRARIDAVLAEFNGDVDRMAEEILYWRSRMKQIAKVVAKVQAEEPFAIIPAGPHWQPGKRERGWWR
jgi:hypothetical protein